MRTSCQAVIVRYEPDPGSGESLNIGVLLLAPTVGFCGARFCDSWRRVSTAFRHADPVHLRRIASAVTRGCASLGGEQLSLYPQGDVVAVLNSLVPANDASLRHSPAITGVTSNPQRTLDELFERYVAPSDAAAVPESRPDRAVWRGIEPILRQVGVLHRLTTHTLRSRHLEEDFDAAWKNSLWNVAAPLSFDMLEPRKIVKKALSWTGRLIELEPTQQQTNVHLVVGVPSASASDSVRQASEDAIGILHDQLEGRDLASVVLESQAETLANRIKHDLEHHDEDE